MDIQIVFIVATRITKDVPYINLLFWFYPLFKVCMRFSSFLGFLYLELHCGKIDCLNVHLVERNWYRWVYWMWDMDMLSWRRRRRNLFMTFYFTVGRRDKLLCCIQMPYRRLVIPFVLVPNFMSMRLPIKKYIVCIMWSRSC